METPSTPTSGAIEMHVVPVVRTDGVVSCFLALGEMKIA